MTVTLTTTDNAEVKAVAQLQRMIALSDTFASAVSSYADRLARVWIEGCPDDKLAAAENAQASEIELPFASIWPMSKGWVGLAGGSSNFMIPRGQIHIYLHYPRDAGKDWNDARLDGLRFLGNWEQDIVALFGADDTATDGSPAVASEGHFAGTLLDGVEPHHVAKEIQASAGDFFSRHFAAGYGDDAGGQQ